MSRFGGLGTLADLSHASRPGGCSLSGPGAAAAADAGPQRDRGSNPILKLPRARQSRTSSRLSYSLVSIPAHAGLHQLTPSAGNSATRVLSFNEYSRVLV